MSVQSIKIDRAGRPRRRSVKSTYEGKNKQSTLTLVKEGGKWKMSALS